VIDKRGGVVAFESVRDVPCGVQRSDVKVVEESKRAEKVVLSGVVVGVGVEVTANDDFVRWETAEKASDLGDSVLIFVETGGGIIVGGKINRYNKYRLECSREYAGTEAGGATSDRRNTQVKLIIPDDGGTTKRTTRAWQTRVHSRGRSEADLAKGGKAVKLKAVKPVFREQQNIV
jgi:hypothetical protein